MLPVAVALFLFLSLTFFAQDACAGQGLRFRGLDLGRASAAAINDHGDVAANSSAGPILILADGTTKTLGIEGKVIAMNNRRQMLVMQDEDKRLFLVQPDGTMEPRTFPGSSRFSYYYRYGLNNAGSVVGWVADVGSVLWDENGRASILREPLEGLSGLGVAMSLNDAGEIAGAYAYGGTAQVYRRSPDGFSRYAGSAIRMPEQMGLSNNGSLVYSHWYSYDRASAEIHSGSDAVVYAAGTSAKSKDPFPWFTGISPNGQRLIGFYFPEGPAFLAETCPAEVTASETTIGLEGGAVTVSVKADPDCEWYSHASGRQRGNGEVPVTIPAAAAPKTSHVWVAWQEVSIRQEGGACEYALPGSAYLMGAEGGTIQVPVNTEPGCPWVASSNEHVELFPTIGIGPGVLRATVQANEYPQAQRLLIRVGGAVEAAWLTIHQDRTKCRWEVTFPPELGAGSGAALLTQQTQRGCHFMSGTDVEWLRSVDVYPVLDNPNNSHEVLVYEANSTGQSRRAEVTTGLYSTGTPAITATRQQTAAAGDALLVEPAASTGPRQKFRFTFAEPAGEPEVSIGKACRIRQRGGFFPFAIEGSCQLNDAGVTTVAGHFRTIDLDVTLAERGPMRISSGSRSLGAFVATDRAPESPRFTAPAPHSGAAGFYLDSDHGYGGTFRMVVESNNRTPIRTVTLSFGGSHFISRCSVELNAASRELTVITHGGTGDTRSGPIELGGTGTAESDACIVKGAGGAYTVLSPDGSRAVWDVTVLFRSSWSGSRFASVAVRGEDGEVVNPNWGIVYRVDPQVTPSLAMYSDLVRVGISSTTGIASARVAAGACLFEYDSGGLRAGAGQPCRLDLSRSTTVAEGGNLTLILAYSGDGGGGAGVRPLKVEATPVGGVASGWLSLGTVPAR